MAQTYDDDFDERLVYCVHTFPVIWEMKRNSYKDKVAKDNAWKNISEILRHSEQDCKKRWRNIRDAYKRNKKRAITGSAATKSKYTDNDHLKFLNASLTERESQCTIEENDGSQYTVEENDGLQYSDEENEREESTQSYRTEENTEDGPSCAQQSGASKEVMLNNEILSDVLQKESTNKASNVKILKSKRIRNECSTSNESTVNQPEGGASNENLSRKIKRKKTHFAPYNTQIWKEVYKNQTERFEVIKRLLQNPNETEVVENKRHPIYKFFESLAETVIQFPPDLIAETRAKVVQIVTYMELRQIARSSQPIMSLQRQLPTDNMLKSRSALSTSDYSSLSAISPHNTLLVTSPDIVMVQSHLAKALVNPSMRSQKILIVSFRQHFN